MKRVLACALLVLATCGSDAAPPLPSADVDLVIDDQGITHVFAQNDRDAMFGAGYAVARDRLLQMELLRRRVKGTQAEVLGPELAVEDMKARAFDLRGLGLADARRLRHDHPADAAVIEAWTAGVNHRLDEIRSGAAPRPYGLRELDLHPSSWTLEDVCALAKAFAFEMSSTIEEDVLATVFQRLAPETATHIAIVMPAYDDFITGAGSPKRPVAQRPAPARVNLAPPRGVRSFFSFHPLLGGAHGRGGSNNWAVDGTHTIDGRPLLAGDPHQPLGSPTLGWPVHLHGDTLDVIGFAFVGMPMVIFGHNAHLGWTATTNFADAMDIWDVQVDSAFTKARIGDQLLPLTRRKETIHVKGAPDIVLDVRTLPGYGVFLPEEVLPVPRAFIADGQLLVNWTGFRETRELAGFLAMDRARDLDSFEAAVRLLDVGALNFIAADATGIDYTVHAAVPDRGPPAAHAMPWHTMSGNDAQSFWKRGDLSDDKMPHLRAPASGILASANNDPFGFTADGSVENDAFYWGAFYDKGFRAHRIREALDALVAHGKISRTDMETLQGDSASPLAEWLVPRLFDAVAAIPTDEKLASFRGRPELADLAARLSGWDKRFVRDAGPPVIFVGLEWFAAQRATATKVPAAVFDAISQRSPEFLLGALRNLLEGRYGDPSYFIPDGERVLLVSALSDTAAWLQSRFGALDGFAWRDIHGAVFPTVWGEAGDGGRAAVDGHDDTIDISQAPFFDQGMPLSDLSSTEGPLFRMVVGFAADGTPEATLDFARGTSGEPDSPHFADQQPGWIDNVHAPLRFRRADVDAAASERILLPKAVR